MQLMRVQAEGQPLTETIGRQGELSSSGSTPARMLAIGLVLVSLLGACATSDRSHREYLSQIAPLQYAGQTVELSDVDFLAPTPELLELDDEMRSFVETYTGHLNHDRMRMVQLHQAIKSDAILNIQYMPGAEGGAADVFHRGTANCLSYANLFVALAREANLKADYQWVKVRPQWTRVGERIAVRLHVNVVVRLRSTVEYVVDIEPLTAAERTKTNRISDIDAFALHHNNVAMEALARSELDQAWAHSVRALRLNPKMSLLWVNLGAIYRLAGQHEEAERSYFHALQLNSADRSAMNNLVVLYDLEGREEESKYWNDKVAYYRMRNPYYHAWLGDKAGEADDWPQALMHYTDALRLEPEGTQLQYEMGVIHYQLGNLEDAARYMSMAIASATLRADVESYKTQLDVIRKEQLADLN
ncbi:MAG: tetratricopeptide repeat protein [Proteobacteria bacterium]|nr:tetratricopeptide repeat protein [Pseudomonadota bacterium]